MTSMDMLLWASLILGFIFSFLYANSFPLNLLFYIPWIIVVLHRILQILKRKKNEHMA